MQPCVTVVKRPCNSTRCMSLYYTKRQLNHNLMYTVDHTFGYSSKKLTCSNLSVYANYIEFRGGNFKHFKASVGCAK